MAIANVNKEPITGKLQKTDDSVFNVADMLSNVYDSSAKMIRTGAFAFKVTANFTRPGDTNIYAVDDAITDSTTSPTVMQFDLSTFGGVANQLYQIMNARIISSVKGSVMDLNANLWLFNQTFASTNDNSALSIDDATSQTGGIVIPCLNAYRNASNHRCVSEPGTWIGRLGSSDTKLYGILQAANTYTPSSSEVFYIILEGLLL